MNGSRYIQKLYKISPKILRKYLPSLLAQFFSSLWSWQSGIPLQTLLLLMHLNLSWHFHAFGMHVNFRPACPNQKNKSPLKHASKLMGYRVLGIDRLKIKNRKSTRIIRIMNLAYQHRSNWFWSPIVAKNFTIQLIYH